MRRLHVSMLISNAPSASQPAFYISYFRKTLEKNTNSHGDDVIHWFHRNGAELRLHSYYDNQDQLGHQDQNFRGRTSLFQDQISRGNASLLLTGVKVQDEGIYKCYTSTVHQNRETFMSLSVNVSTIRIHQDGNRITCSSEGIYPQPELTWSTEPPSNTTLQNRTTVHQTEEKLYDISITSENHPSHSQIILPLPGSRSLFSSSLKFHAQTRSYRLASELIIIKHPPVSLTDSLTRPSALTSRPEATALYKGTKPPHHRLGPSQVVARHFTTSQPNQSIKFLLYSMS
uniref:Ig-like domain-containing protein n=1 Tax=Xiphophorus couchianus TaxID=32473 RepID=A0A3B5MIK1_9TELE